MITIRNLRVFCSVAAMVGTLIFGSVPVFAGNTTSMYLYVPKDSSEPDDFQKSNKINEVSENAEQTDTPYKDNSVNKAFQKTGNLINTIVPKTDDFKGVMVPVLTVVITVSAGAEVISLRNNRLVSSKSNINSKRNTYKKEV